MEMIRLSSVHFAYNGLKVINGVTHIFERGSFTGVLGPNGSGKTTLIRLMSGILKPASGEVIVIDRPSVSYRAREMARQIAYVTQTQYNMFPATVFDTVLLGRNPYVNWSPDADDKRVTADIIVRLGLDDIAMKDINRLSGGQRQRVFIARALAQQPSILLLDEPTASLDLKYQHETMKILSELRDEGMTIIVTIHDLNLALKYCSSFMILNKGSLAAEGGREIFSTTLLEEIYEIKIRIVRDTGQMYIFPA